MSIRLSFNNGLAAIVLLSLFPIDTLCAYSLEQDRTRGNVHGLYEINQEAVKFLNNENKRTGINRESLEPNLKILVERCAVPLKANWTPKEFGRKKYSVGVRCEQTISGKKWRVDIPTAER